MTQEGYAKDHLLFYPGAGLSASERDRMERYDISIAEVTVDHLVYSMGRQIENNFQSFYTVAEELVGKESALAIAQRDRPAVRRPGLCEVTQGPGPGGPRRASDDGAVPGPRALDPGPEARGQRCSQSMTTRDAWFAGTIASTSARRTRATARTPRRSRPDASRGTSLRTTTCWPSR